MKVPLSRTDLGHFAVFVKNINNNPVIAAKLRLVAALCKAGRQLSNCYGVISCVLALLTITFIFTSIPSIQCCRLRGYHHHQRHRLAFHLHVRFSHSLNSSSPTETNPTAPVTSSCPRTPIPPNKMFLYSFIFAFSTVTFIIRLVFRCLSALRCMICRYIYVIYMYVCLHASIGVFCCLQYFVASCITSFDI